MSQYFISSKKQNIFQYKSLALGPHSVEQTPSMDLPRTYPSDWILLYSRRSLHTNLMCELGSQINLLIPASLGTDTFFCWSLIFTLRTLQPLTSQFPGGCKQSRIGLRDLKERLEITVLFPGSVGLLPSVCFCHLPKHSVGLGLLKGKISTYEKKSRKYKSVSQFCRHEPALTVLKVSTKVGAEAVSDQQ